MELAGKRLLLSGATGGLGRAIAVELAGQGAIARPQLPQGRGARAPRAVASGGRRPASERGRGPGRARGAPRIWSSARATSMAWSPTPPCPPPAGSSTSARRRSQRALRVNLESPILIARALGSKLAEKGQGHLVFISSLAGKVGSPRSSLYNATKFGLRGFVFGLREDMHPYGVGVSVVSPGFVREAGMFADADAKPPPGSAPRRRRRWPRPSSARFERNRNEITVAPFRQRLLVEFGYRHPEFAARVQRARRGGEDRRESRGGSGRQALGSPARVKERRAARTRDARARRERRGRCGSWFCWFRSIAGSLLVAPVAHAAITSVSRGSDLHAYATDEVRECGTSSAPPSQHRGELGRHPDRRQRRLPAGPERHRRPLPADHRRPRLRRGEDRLRRLRLDQRTAALHQPRLRRLQHDRPRLPRVLRHAPTRSPPRRGLRQTATSI